MTGKPDEQALWAAVEAGEEPRAAGDQLRINAKRVAYLCQKWADRGIYDYGVCVDLGWATVGDVWEAKMRSVTG